MKVLHNFFVTISIFMLAATINAYAAPKISCARPSYDFGSINSLQKVRHKFIIRNSGDTLLQIGNLRACCGGKGEISTNRIQPGQTANIDVELALKGRKGRQNKSFYVASNDPHNPYLKLTLQGEALTNLDISPRLLIFSNISTNSVVRKEARVECRASYRFSIKNISCDIPFLSVNHNSDQERKSHKIEVSTVPPLASGTTKGVVRIFTDNEKVGVLSLNVRIEVSPDVMLVPRELVLIDSDNPQPVTRYFALRSRAKKPFNILKIEVPESGMGIDITQLENGYSCKLSNIMPFADLNEKTVLVYTDHEECEMLTLPVLITKGAIDESE